MHAPRSFFTVLATLAFLASSTCHALINGWLTQDARFDSVGSLLTLIPTAKGGLLAFSCVGTRLSKHTVLTSAHCTVPYLRKHDAQIFFLTDSFLKRWGQKSSDFKPDALLDLLTFKDAKNPLEAFRSGTEFAQTKNAVLSPWLPENYVDIYQDEVLPPPKDFTPATFYHQKKPGDDWQKDFDLWQTSLFDIAILEVETPTDKILSNQKQDDPTWQPVRDAVRLTEKPLPFEISNRSHRKKGRIVHLIAYEHQKNHVLSRKTFALFQYTGPSTVIPESMERMGLFTVENVPDFRKQMSEPGDSGSPVFEAVPGKYLLTGVLSGMGEDGNLNFVSTAPHAEWIQKQIQQIEAKY